MLSGESPGKASAKGKHYATFGAKSVSGAAIYYMGIVDFLQDWTTRKKVERMTKIYLLGHEAEGTSVMHPTPYKTRFQNKMDEIFDLELLESRRRDRLKNKFKKSGSTETQNKRPISGRAIAPAGTSLNKNRKSNRHIDGMASVGFVDVPEENENDASDVAQQPQPVGSGVPDSIPENVDMAEPVEEVQSVAPFENTSSSTSKKKSKKGKKVTVQEFTDVDI